MYKHLLVNFEYVHQSWRYLRWTWSYVLQICIFVSIYDDRWTKFVNPRSFCSIDQTLQRQTHDNSVGTWECLCMIKSTCWDVNTAVIFNIQSVSSLIVCRRQKFLTKCMNIDNSVCSSVLGCARRDLNDLIWLIWLFIFSLVSVSCLLSVFFAVIEWRIKLYIY